MNKNLFSSIEVFQGNDGNAVALEEYTCVKSFKTDEKYKEKWDTTKRVSHFLLTKY